MFMPADPSILTRKLWLISKQYVFDLMIIVMIMLKTLCCL